MMLIAKLFIPPLPWWAVGIVALLFGLALVTAWFIKPYIAYRRMLRPNVAEITAAAWTASVLGAYRIWPSCAAVSLVRGDETHVLVIDYREYMTRANPDTFIDKRVPLSQRCYVPIPKSKYDEGRELGKAIAVACRAEFRCAEDENNEQKE